VPIVVRVTFWSIARWFRGAANAEPDSAIVNTAAVVNKLSFFIVVTFSVRVGFTRLTRVHPMRFLLWE
jgi:hypothetical protein